MLRGCPWCTGCRVWNCCWVNRAGRGRRRGERVRLSFSPFDHSLASRASLTPTLTRHSIGYNSTLSSTQATKALNTRARRCSAPLSLACLLKPRSNKHQPYSIDTTGPRTTRSASHLITQITSSGHLPASRTDKLRRRPRRSSHKSGFAHSTPSASRSAP